MALTHTIIFAPKAKRPPFLLSSAAEQVLCAFATYPMLSAHQVCRLYYAKGSQRRAESLLKHLADNKYLLRLPHSLPFVYALATRGRQYLTRRKLPVRHRFRPSDALHYSPY